MADPRRTEWNQRQKTLQAYLQHPETHPEMIDLFLEQHAPLHAREVANDPYPFDAELWEGLSEADARRIPPGSEHSIAWMIWHIARIEDMTMNVLVAGEPQLYDQESWAARLHAPIRDTGNALDLAAVEALSAGLDIAALRAYRSAAGCRTREIVRQVPLVDWKRRVDPARLQMLWDQEDIPHEAGWLAEYWGGRTLAGLLLMPATRHLLVHLNEAVQAKTRLQRNQPHKTIARSAVWK